MSNRYKPIVGMNVELVVSSFAKEEESPTKMQVEIAKSIATLFGIEDEYSLLETKADYSFFISKYMRDYKKELKRMESLK